jgi:hypothetical protein
MGYRTAIVYGQRSFRQKLAAAATISAKLPGQVNGFFITNYAWNSVNKEMHTNCNTPSHLRRGWEWWVKTRGRKHGETSPPFPIP